MFYFPKHFISPPELWFDIERKGGDKTWLNQAQVWVAQCQSQHLSQVLQGSNPRHGRNQNNFFTLSRPYHEGRANPWQRSAGTQRQLVELALCSPVLIKTVREWLKVTSQNFGSTDMGSSTLFSLFPPNKPLSSCLCCLMMIKVFLAPPEPACPSAGSALGSVKGWFNGVLK